MMKVSIYDSLTVVTHNYSHGAKEKRLYLGMAQVAMIPNKKKEPMIVVGWMGIPISFA